MICIDCQKSYDGTGMRCIRCTQLFERRQVASQQIAQGDSISISKFRKCRILIYCGVAVAVLDLIRTISIWAMFKYWKAPATTASMALMKEYISPWILTYYAVLILGVALKFRLAGLLLFCSYSVSLFIFYGTLEVILLHPLSVVLLVVYFFTMVGCFNWHRIKNRLLERLEQTQPLS